MSNGRLLDPGQGTEHERPCPGDGDKRRLLEPFPLPLVEENAGAQAQFFFGELWRDLGLLLLEPGALDVQIRLDDVFRRRENVLDEVLAVCDCMIDRPVDFDLIHGGAGKVSVYQKAHTENAGEQP